MASVSNNQSAVESQKAELLNQGLGRKSWYDQATRKTEEGKTVWEGWSLTRVLCYSLIGLPIIGIQHLARHTDADPSSFNALLKQLKNSTEELAKVTGVASQKLINRHEDVRSRIVGQVVDLTRAAASSDDENNTAQALLDAAKQLVAEQFKAVHLSKEAQKVQNEKIIHGIQKGLVQKFLEDATQEGNDVSDDAFKKEAKKLAEMKVFPNKEEALKALRNHYTLHLQGKDANQVKKEIRALKKEDPVDLPEKVQEKIAETQDKIKTLLESRNPLCDPTQKGDKKTYKGHRLEFRNGSLNQAEKAWIDATKDLAQARRVLIQKHSKTAGLESILADAESRDPSGNSPHITKAKAKLREHNAQLNKLNEKFNDKDAAVDAAKAKIAKLRKEYEKISKEIVEARESIGIPSNSKDNEVVDNDEAEKTVIMERSKQARMLERHLMRPVLSDSSDESPLEFYAGQLSLIGKAADQLKKIRTAAMIAFANKNSIKASDVDDDDDDDNVEKEEDVAKQIPAEVEALQELLEKIEGFGELFRKNASGKTLEQGLAELYSGKKNQIQATRSLIASLLVRKQTITNMKMEAASKQPLVTHFNY